MPHSRRFRAMTSGKSSDCSLTRSWLPDNNNGNNILIRPVVKHTRQRLWASVGVLFYIRTSRWRRRFIDSDNPVAAALLAKMRYNESEIREVRFAYLRMLLRLRRKLDDAKLALIMSVADLYNKCDIREDESLLQELGEKYPEEGDIVDKLMPAWSREGYEKGIKEGIEQGMEHGVETVAINMLREGMDPDFVSKVTGWPEQKIAELRKRFTK